MGDDVGTTFVVGKESMTDNYDTVKLSKSIIKSYKTYEKDNS